MRRSVRGVICDSVEELYGVNSQIIKFTSEIFYLLSFSCVLRSHRSFAVAGDSAFGTHFPVDSKILDHRVPNGAY